MKQFYEFVSFVILVFGLPFLAIPIIKFYFQYLQWIWKQFDFGFPEPPAQAQGGGKGA